MNHFQPSDAVLSTAKSGNMALPASAIAADTCTACPLWLSATGNLSVPMTNDYLFRALLQKNNKVLKGLISSLLHLSPSDISSAVITNPIELGDAINHKTFILDIKVSLNDSTTLSLEMQVINEHNWVDRSLSYLCRNFDQLMAGEKYQNIRPVIQIGLLNFTLFPESPEFYATYKFLNVKNHTLYSDKLRLSVLDLTQTKLATEEDKSYQLDHYSSALMRTQVARNPPVYDGSLLTTCRASLFKATTWEEITMLAQKNEYIGEATDTIYQLTQDEKIRMQCEAREDYYRTQRGWQDMLDEKAAMLSEMDIILNEKDAMLNKKDTIIAEQKEALETTCSELNKLLAWAKEHGYEK